MQIVINCISPEVEASATAVMARLNALFPPCPMRAGVDDIDLTPYSPGLRDNIRFSIYEHLMTGHKDSDPKQVSLQTCLLSRCNLPGYGQAWQAFTRYAEEYKKMETMCFEILHELEIRKRRSTSATSPLDSSFLTASSESHSSGAATPAIRAQETPDETPNSPGSYRSTLSVATSVWMRPPPSPLLKGMPGREISCAKTDGAAFAGDTDAPPILTYPNDLSPFHFEEHPLAKSLDISLREKVQVALVLPKQLASRDF